MIPALDLHARQTIATGIVHDALKAFFTDRVEYAGDDYRLTWVQENHRDGDVHGCVSFQVEDDTHGPVAAVTVLVNAEPLAWVGVDR